MAATTEKKIREKKKEVVSKNTPDYANDPFFVKKREFATEFIKKHGLPESFTKK
jgi:hypothetical protein